MIATAQGTFNATNGPNVVWTAPAQEGNVPVTVTAADNIGNQANASTTIQVIRRVVITFEDVHFDFDRFNLRPDALKILDDAVSNELRELGAELRFKPLWLEDLVGLARNLLKVTH